MKPQRYRVRVIDAQERGPIDWEKLRSMAIAVLEDRRAAIVRLNVVLMDDATIAPIHERYLGESGPTDVISFRYERPINEIDGEVMISVETAEREAAHRKISLEEELLRYVAHGVLHFLGFEDDSPENRKKMFEHQERLVRKLKVGLVRK